MEIQGCAFCNEDFDLVQRIPRLMNKCGHSICENCLSHFIKEEMDIICPVDQS